MKKYVVKFVVTDHMGKFQDEIRLEDSYAETEEEAVALVRQWLIDTSILHGCAVDFEDISYIDGIHVKGNNVDRMVDQDYSFFRVIESVSHETNTKKRGTYND